MSLWRVRIDDARSGAHDVVIDASPDSLVDDLKLSLAAAGFSSGVSGLAMSAGRTLADLRLAHGASIACGGPSPSSRQRRPGTYLVVVGGLRAGSFLRVEPHEQLVGRSPEAHLRVEDALVGRQHCSVRLAPDLGVVITDLGSTSGTVAEGRPIETPTTVEPGKVVQCGATLLAVEEVVARDLPALADVDDGARPFARHFREALTPIPLRLRAPSPLPEEEPTSRGTWWRPLLPLFSGVALALLTGRWQFLIVMALGPIVLLVESQRTKKARVKARAQKVARAQAEFNEHQAVVGSTLAEEQLRRRRLAPGAGLAIVHATLQTRQLWARASEDEDFASVTVGYASLATALTIEGQSQQQPSELWRVPVVVPLVQTGSLAILGAPKRSQAVARGLLLSLAASHSPNDLRIWVLTDELRAPGWDFARWLPHSFLDGGGARLAVDADARGALLKLLGQVLESRLEAASKTSLGSVQLPLDVVVLDWAGSASNEDVAALLSKGGRLGILGLAVEAEMMLEGVGGTVRLSSHADAATFESRLQPRVDGMVVAEVDAQAATTAARALAGLRPAVGAAGQADPGEIRLLDLLPEGTDDAALAATWGRAAPSTRVVVGRSSGTLMHVDVVKDGPHGLVGGTTRSGKTEFLKTLFASLMIANSPDELSILIVDFKGGVDHAAFLDVPHVISLTTNADVDRFSRTIELLVAEQRRRQRVFAACGAANIDAYAAVRRSDPSALPMPRLLVVVDEFGELLSTETGKAHLKALESVTRVGSALGVHLLLVTQTFEGQLPAQIAANTGLRICFRVQQPSDSKVVLDTGAAAGIPKGRPGRAYSRSQRGDLVEFQSARVAGRRPDLRTGPPPVRVLPAPLGALVGFSTAELHEEVPLAESDLAAILESLRQAARRTGWTASAIPWPEELPRLVPVTTLFQGPAGHVPLGLADVPDEQAQEAVFVGPDDEQVLIVGGPSSGAGAALLTLATSASVRMTPDLLHLYAIDLADGVLAPLASLPNVGSVAVRNEPLSLKIVRRLLDMAAERRALMASHGVSSAGDLAGRGVALPRVVLALHGAERLVAKEENSATPLTAAVLRLLAETPGTGIHLWLTGTSVLGYHRLGTSIARRVVLPIPDTNELPNLGVPRGSAAALDGPGRGYDVVEKRVVQLASLSDRPGEVPAADVVRALGVRLHDRWRGSAGGPERLVDVTWPLPFELVALDAMVPPDSDDHPFPVGIDLGRGEWAWLDAVEDGPVIGVVGATRSGRSSALLAIAELGRAAGWRIIGLPASRRSRLWHPDATLDQVLGVSAAQPVQLGELHEQTIIMVDDAHRLEVDDIGLSKLLHAEHPVVLVVAGAVDFVSRRSGFLRTLPRMRSGIVLAPSGSGDGSAFGLSRIPDAALAEGRAGRGLLVSNGEWREHQLPYRAAWAG